jgi:hypothetical protein
MSCWFSQEIPCLFWNPASGSYPKPDKSKPLFLTPFLSDKGKSCSQQTTKELESQQGQEFSFLHIIQTGSGAHPALHPLGTRGTFPREVISLICPLWFWEELSKILLLTYSLPKKHHKMYVHVTTTASSNYATLLLQQMSAECSGIFKTLKKEQSYQSSSTSN